MSSTFRRAALITAVLAIAAAGCGEKKEPTAAAPEEAADVGVVESDEPGTPGGSITYGLSAETDGWNPSTSRWAPSGLMVARAVFDTLATYDAEGGWQPNLAESFTPNEEYTAWQVKLRPGVTFHNGDPVDADAVKANMDFHIASPLTSAPFEPVENVESDGELTVTVNTKAPWVNWPYAMATQIGVVGEPDWLASGDTRAPIGTGPFTFESWEPDKELVVRKNADYWRDGYPYLDEVVFQPIIDSQSRSSALESGDLDAMLISDGEDIVDFTALAESGEFQLFSDTVGESNESFVQLNVTKPPFDDPDARRALALATDKQQVIDTVQAGLYEPSSGPFPPSSPWYVPTEYPEADPAEAAELASAYAAEHGGPITFELLTPPDPTSQQTADLLIDQWGAAGIEASSRTIQQAEGILQVLTGNYQSVIWAQFDSPHPLGDSVWWHPNSVGEEGEFSLNFSRNKNEAIGEALDAARATTDPAEEKRLYGVAQEELAKDIPYVWLYHYQTGVVAGNDLVNVTNWTTPDGAVGLPLQGGSHPLFQVWLDDGASEDEDED